MSERGPRAKLQDAVRQVRWSARKILRRQLRITVEMRWRLGDEIMAIPIYEAIKRRHPFCFLSVISNHPDLLFRNPYVDEVLGPNDRVGTCDRYIVLRGAPRERVRIEHYATVAGVPVPLQNPRLYYDDWRSAFSEHPDLQSKQFIVVCTGGTWQTKRWPAAHWQSLCAALARDGERIVQLGGDDLAAGAALDLRGKTSIREAACILRAARLLISTDTGLMHLALAVGTPVLALFGPTDPRMLVRDHSLLVALTNTRDCHGCWNHAPTATREGVCPLQIDSCMGALAADVVLAKAREMLG
ncbi:MAG TPA: glycosyltransferase family 9 protein, partial [Candidatus Hydrogenedentes bacterium]|nr:glycosyltransferase family 9 protein [Candidatus Hydrogenedentota bacterium]